MEKYIKLFKSAADHNWDNGHEPLKKILNSPDCDKGTALLIYWLAKPEYYAKYEYPEAIPNMEWEAYQFILKVAQILVEKNLPEIIAFDPSPFRNEKNLRIKNPDFVLKQFYKPTKGEINGNELIGQ